MFGPEPYPGIDNDPHITILLTPLPGLNGYFSSADAYPKVVNPFSNQRKMIYIAVRRQATPRTRTTTSRARWPTSSSNDPLERPQDRDVWLDEGCSEIAMYINGYDPGGFDLCFTAQPDVQLNAWGSEPGQRAHYGASYLFLRYLMDRYGGESFISKLMKQHGLGIGAIDATLKQAGNPAGFEGAFKDWIVANRLNNASIAGGRYSYTEGGRAQEVEELNSYPASYSDTVHQYAADTSSSPATLAPPPSRSRATRPQGDGRQPP